MTFGLQNLKPFAGSRTRTKRVGRGNASGRGTYSGRGQKGQRARSGGRKGLTLFGLKRILQSVPKKRGFKSLASRPSIVNLKSLNELEPNSHVDPKFLLERGLVRDIKNGVKILGDGDLKVALTVSDCLVSQGAKEKIEKAGGKVEVASSK